MPPVNVLTDEADSDQESELSQTKQLLWTGVFSACERESSQFQIMPKNCQKLSKLSKMVKIGKHC